VPLKLDLRLSHRATAFRHRDFLFLGMFDPGWTGEELFRRADRYSEDALQVHGAGCGLDEEGRVQVVGDVT
jgi:hypothetical protein